MIWLIASYVVSTAAGLVLIKLGSSSRAIIDIVDGKLGFHPTTLNVLGLILYGVSFVLYTYLVSKNDLGFIIPLTTAIVYILIFVASAIVFHESFTVLKMIGVALIFVGVTLLNMNK